MPLEPGSRLGPYEILAPLAAGGMGEVYRARDTVLQRDVAIKVLPASWSRDPERLRRFRLEAQATAALNHPNVISIFYVGEHDCSPYIVTELLQGETLRERLRHGSMRLREVLDIGVDIAHGLAAAHGAGVVHRDLKPENIFLTRDGRIKLLDFGLAKRDLSCDPHVNLDTITVHRTEPGYVVGTVAYMSPEQVREEVADARSDIFAVGVILYEMLAGQRPFRKKSSAETMAAILHEDPEPILQTGLEIPLGMQKVVNRCVAKNPEQRFQHSSDLAFALEALSDASGFSGGSFQPVSRASHAASSDSHPSELQAIAAPGSANKLEKPVERPGNKWIWIALGATGVALLAALLQWWSRAPGIPAVEAINQITDDGRPKGVHNSLQTDGLRLYFNEGRRGTLTIAQVAVTGGSIATIPTPLVDAQPVGIAPDASFLLVLQGGAGPPAKPAWKVPLPTGDPIRMGNLEAQDGRVTPDGHVLFSNLGDLYLTDSDGSNARKIISNFDGFIGDQNMSPDSRQIVFTRYPVRDVPELFVTNSDGSGIRLLAKNSEAGGFCCAEWTPDGRYLVFETRANARQDLWYLPMERRWPQRPSEPKKLTAGPISFHDPVPSRDGKTVFALGTKERGELVRYDSKAKQFVPFLGGISATNVSFSKDGKWVAYRSFPDRTLWRSRVDGTDRLQLAYSPVGENNTFSPDGKRLEYEADGNIYLIAVDGGQPQAIVSDGKSGWADWSPAGNMLVFFTDGEANMLNLASGRRSVVPGAHDLEEVRWIAEDKLVARSSENIFTIFDMKNQTWSNWAIEPKPEVVSRWGVSPEQHYLYYAAGGAEPALMRVRLGDNRAETITSLKDFPFAMFIQQHSADWLISVAPDGSPLLTRDIGSQEIYALSVKWP